MTPSRKRPFSLAIVRVIPFTPAPSPKVYFFSKVIPNKEGKKDAIFIAAVSVPVLASADCLATPSELTRYFEGFMGFSKYLLDVRRSRFGFIEK